MTTDELYEEHKGIIYHCAQSFRPTKDLSLDDYISIGNLAFTKCAPKYKSDSGAFSTFLYICVKHAIITAINKNKKNQVKSLEGQKPFYSNPRPFTDYILDTNMSDIQKEIVYMIMEGYNGKEIQESLGIDKKEYKKQKSKIALILKRQTRDN